MSKKISYSEIGRAAVALRKTQQEFHTWALAQNGLNFFPQACPVYDQMIQQSKEFASLMDAACPAPTPVKTIPPV